MATLKSAWGGSVRASRPLIILMAEVAPAAQPVCPKTALTLPRAMGAARGGNTFAAAPTSTASPTGVAVACASRNWMLEGSIPQAS